jgi:hypothetical protein
MRFKACFIEAVAFIVKFMEEVTDFNAFLTFTLEYMEEKCGVYETAIRKHWPFRTAHRLNLDEAYDICLILNDFYEEEKKTKWKDLQKEKSKLTEGSSLFCISNKKDDPACGEQYELNIKDEKTGMICGLVLCKEKLELIKRAISSSQTPSSS